MFFFIFYLVSHPLPQVQWMEQRMLKRIWVMANKHAVKVYVNIYRQYLAYETNFLKSITSYGSNFDFASVSVPPNTKKKHKHHRDGCYDKITV